MPLKNQQRTGKRYFEFYFSATEYNAIGITNTSNLNEWGGGYTHRLSVGWHEVKVDYDTGIVLVDDLKIGTISAQREVVAYSNGAGGVGLTVKVNRGQVPGRTVAPNGYNWA